MRKEKEEEQLFRVGLLWDSSKWRVEMGNGSTLRRECLLLTVDGFVNESKSLSFSGHARWLQSPSSYEPECVGEWKFYQVAGFCMSNTSWTRCHLRWSWRPYLQDPQAAPKSYETDSGELPNFVHSSPVHSTQAPKPGGREVGRGKLSSKWEIQSNSFRKVYS